MNMMSFMPSCREVTDSLAGEGLESVPWHKRLLIRVHLSMCVHCSKYARQLELIAQALRQRWEAPMSPEALEAVKRRIMSRLK